MNTSRSVLGRLLSTLAAAVAMLPLPSLAQSDEVDPEALQMLRRSTDYLAGINRFRLDTDATIEAILPSGQKLQYGQRVAITVQRPDKVRAERIGELVNQTFYYDGKTLAVDLPERHYHATIDAPTTLEAMLDFARDRLSIIAPGSDLIYKDAYDRLTQGLTSAYVVGKAVVAGVPCDHIAFRNAEVDWQIWIQEGARPVPRKFIVTSKRVAGAPQFVVVMSKWDAAPKVTDSTFKFAPPKDSRRIDFVQTAAAK